MTRNEVIAELMKLRQRCARLKCSPTGKTEEWARSEDALGFAINALRHMQYGEWIFHPDGKLFRWSVLEETQLTADWYITHGGDHHDQRRQNPQGDG